MNSRRCRRTETGPALAVAHKMLTMHDSTREPIRLLRPKRRITGMSAILLPFATDGSIDWPAFRAHVLRTADAGLTPAVNMDTGYVNLLDDATRVQVLEETKRTLAGRAFIAGA